MSEVVDDAKTTVAEAADKAAAKADDEQGEQAE